LLLNKVPISLIPALLAENKVLLEGKKNFAALRAALLIS